MHQSSADDSCFGFELFDTSPDDSTSIQFGQQPRGRVIGTGKPRKTQKRKNCTPQETSPLRETLEKGKPIIKAGDLCYMRFPLWEIIDDEPVVHQYYSVLRVVSIHLDEHAQNPSCKNAEVVNIQFQLVYCPLQDTDVQETIKNHIVFKSPYAIASWMVSKGKTNQQPHLNGKKHIYKLPEDLDGVHKYQYQSDTGVDPNISELKPVISRLDAVRDSHVFVNDKTNNAQSSIRVLVDSRRLQSTAKELEYMRNNPAAMSLWGSSTVLEQFSGLQGYAPVAAKLSLPVGWAYDGKTTMQTPTGQVDIHIFSKRLVREITSFRNGFRMGDMGTVYVPIQSPDTKDGAADMDDMFNLPVYTTTGGAALDYETDSNASSDDDD